MTGMCVGRQVIQKSWGKIITSYLKNISEQTANYLPDDDVASYEKNETHSNYYNGLSLCISQAIQLEYRFFFSGYTEEILG